MFRICHVPETEPVPGCPVCSGTLEPDITRIATDVVNRYASRQVRAAPKGKNLLRNCTKKDGIWYATQRLSKEGLLDTADLDFHPFYDEVSIKKVLPVILVQSPYSTPLPYSLICGATTCWSRGNPGAHQADFLPDRRCEKSLVENQESLHQMQTDGQEGRGARAG